MERTVLSESQVFCEVSVLALEEPLQGHCYLGAGEGETPFVRGFRKSLEVLDGFCRVLAGWFGSPEDICLAERQRG